MKPAKRSWTALRHAVQVLVTLLFIAAPLIVGRGLAGSAEGDDIAAAVPADLPFWGTLSSSQVGSVTLLDPFATLQAAAASLSFDPIWLLGVLPVLAFYGLVRARAFCGWVCPVNLVLELVDALRAKLKISLPERSVPRRAKMLFALAAIVLSGVAGFPVFEAFSPVSAANKAIVIGSCVGLVTLALIVLLELFWSHRVWCRALCPLGGFYEALGRVGFLKVAIDHKACTSCGLCKRKCLADPEILDPAIRGGDAAVYAGDCMACGACIDACPEDALRYELMPPRFVAASHAASDASDAAEQPA